MTKSLTIILSRHAVDRFHERVRPSLDRAGADEALARLIPGAELTSQPPAWHARGTAQQADGYLDLGDVVLPLRRSGDEYLATTCFALGGISEATRARRNRSRVRRRARSLAGSPRRR